MCEGSSTRSASTSGRPSSFLTSRKAAARRGSDGSAVSTTRARGVRTDGPKKVLVIGASSGYGLAARITAAFGFGAETPGGSGTPAKRRSNTAANAAVAPIER